MKRYATLICAALCLALAACAPKAPNGEKVVDIAPAKTAAAAPAKTAAATPTPAPATPPATAAPAPAVETPTPSPTGAASEKSMPVEDEAFYYMPLSNALKARITGMSYPAEGEECRIAYDELRYVGILYVDFNGATRAGELIVHRKVAKEVTEIFYALYQNQYPLASVRLVDDYGEPGDDNRSMAANNTSAFNYRRVTGSKKLSRHSYGAAVDINPLYNPYINGDRVSPPDGAQYADRTADFPGKIDHDDLCYRLFTARGWSWGGDFKGDKDYQHFSKDLGY